jgi:hypothetical protein
VIWAVIAYLLAVAGALALEPRVQRMMAGGSFTRWLSERVYLPGLRAAAVTVLLLAAYPDMFSSVDLPTLSEVLSAGPDRGSQLFNLMVLLSIVLPLVVPAGPWGAAVLPVQAALGASVLFHWAVSTAGLTASAVPDLAIVGSVITVATVAEFTARFGESLLSDRYPRWARLVTHDSVVLVFQLPALLIWTRALGSQLT